MEMISEQRIAATREKVWAALNNTEILKQSMPGCESFEAVGDNIFEAQITTKVGPVKAKFKFKVELADIRAPHGYTIKGEGQGGVAGFAPHSRGRERKARSSRFVWSSRSLWKSCATNA